MSRSNPIFDKQPIEVQKRNTFDMSHEVLGSGRVGTLYPVLVEKVQPNDSISLGQRMHIQLPPMATNWYGRCDVKLEAFFVPNRILMGKAWEDYFLFNNGLSTQYQPSGIVKRFLPIGQFSSSDFAPGSLLNWIYGGEKLPLGESMYVNPLPLLAYHKIYDEFYRCPNYTSPLFARGMATTYNTNPGYAPYQHFGSQVTWNNSDSFINGDSIVSLHQRAYGKDYFTNAYLNQNGGATQMQVAVAPFVTPANDGSLQYLVQEVQSGSNDVNLQRSGSGTTTPVTQIGTFSIQQLRSANALQQFAERNSMAGGRYADTLVANYGTKPASAVIDRPVFLGANTIGVYGNSVYQNGGSTTSTNPFKDSVASKAGDRCGAGKDSLIDNFHIEEHGYIIVMCSLVPHAYYSGLISHETAHLNATGLSEVGFTDLFPVPSLAGIGNQPIYLSEVNGDTDTSGSTKYAWCERYSDFKFRNDEVKGLLVDNASLSPFALKRSFTGSQTPSSVAYIRTTDMDDVTAVQSALSNYGYMFDLDFQEIMTRALPAYSIPTLGEPKNTKTIVIDKGGSRL